MYAILSSPLFIGADVRSLSAEALAIYSAKEIIDVNQDPLGAPPLRLWRDVSYSQEEESGHVEAWGKQLHAPNQCAVVILNRATVSAKVSMPWSRLAALGPRWANVVDPEVRDLRRKVSLGHMETAIKVTLKAHASIILRVTL